MYGIEYDAMHTMVDALTIEQLRHLYRLVKDDSVLALQAEAALSIDPAIPAVDDGEPPGERKLASAGAFDSGLGNLSTSIRETLTEYFGGPPVADQDDDLDVESNVISDRPSPESSTRAWATCRNRSTT